jgi:hypothetical protein
MAPWLPWLSYVSPNRLAALFCGLTWFVSLAECIHPTRKAGRQQMGKEEIHVFESQAISRRPREMVHGPVQLWLRSGVGGFPRCWQVAGGPPGCWWQAPVSLRQIFPHEAKLRSRGPGPVVLVRNGSLASAKGNVSPESAWCSIANPTTRMRALVADPSPRKHQGAVIFQPSSPPRFWALRIIGLKRPRACVRRWIEQSIRLSSPKS